MLGEPPLPVFWFPLTLIGLQTDMPIPRHPGEAERLGETTGLRFRSPRRMSSVVIGNAEEIIAKDTMIARVERIFWVFAVEPLGKGGVEVRQTAKDCL